MPAPPYELHPAATPIEWWIIKGETYDIHVPVLDADDQAVEVDGWTAKAQVRRSEREPVLHEWSDADGTAVCTGTTVVLHVDGAATTAWTWRDARVSLEVYEPVTSKPRVIASGVIHALPEITR